MSAFDQVTQEFASTVRSLSPRTLASKRTRGASAPRATGSAKPVTAERERSAIDLLQPDDETPAAQSSASPAKVKRGRQTVQRLRSSGEVSADQHSGSAGADETKDELRTNARTSRRQPSRANAGPAPTRSALHPDENASGPEQLRDDAGQYIGDAQSLAASVRRADQMSIVTQRLGVGAAQDQNNAGHPSSDSQTGVARVRRPGRDVIVRRPEDAGAAQDPEAHASHGHHATSGPGGDDGAHTCGEYQPSRSPVIAEIVALHRLRIRWQKAEIKLVLQAQAECRRWTEGDKVDAAKLYHLAEKGGDVDPLLTIALGPFWEAMRPLREAGAAYDRRLAKAARTLPVWPWVKAVWGFSDIGLAKIVGEAGDVGSYRNPACLWKRLGLAVIGGQRQRRVSDADEALLHGYSPSRRAMVWNIGNSLIGGMGNGVRPARDEDWQAREDWSPYQKLYVGRLIYEAERDPENMARPATAAGKMSFSKHAHNRAKRYVEKRALRDLWSAWRAAERGQGLYEAHDGFAPLGTFPMAAE